MKRYLLIIAAVAVSISSLMAQTLPSLGNCNVKVVGQNLDNYIVGHRNHSNLVDASKYNTDLAGRTNRIVTAFLRMDADIYAMVELETADTALIYLTNAMNAAAGSNVYAYVQDNITDCSSNSGYGGIMAGFIYKKATIETVGQPKAMASGTTYGPRMQAQVFKHKATNEMFVLSMNHFKAQGSGTESTRVNNATQLLQNLPQMTSTDPDVLIMGDLNELTSAEAIQLIINNGYTEMLEYYDASAYSYIYNGNNNLIDHALANNTMASQITGAGVYHVNNGGSSSQKFSDHDAVMVGLNLGGGSVTPSEPDTTVTPDPEEPQGDYCLDTIFDFTTQGIGSFTAKSLADNNIVWEMNSRSQYGIQVNASSNYASAQDDYLISPEIDLSGKASAIVSINHCIYKGSISAERQQLLMTDQYTGDPTTTEWTEVAISQSSTGSTFTVSEQAVPQELLSQGFRFALHYTGKGDQWEVKSAEVKAVCGGTATEALEAQTQVAVKIIRDGQIYILRDGFTYTITGERVQ